LFVFPLRRAFFDEGFHAFFLIFRRKQRVENTALESHAFRKAALEGPIDCFLARQHRRQRHVRDGVGNFHRFLHQACRRHDTRHQPRFFRFSRIHHASGQNQVHGFRFANRMRQALRAADAGNNSKLDLRLAELGGIGSDHDIALHGEFAPAAKRKAGHSRDNRLARLCRGIPVRDEIAEIGLDERLVRHFLDVGPGGEGFVATRDQHATDLVVTIEGLDRLRQLGNQRLVERIEGRRAVEADNSDTALCFNDDVLVGHD